MNLSVNYKMDVEYTINLGTNEPVSYSRKQEIREFYRSIYDHLKIGEEGELPLDDLHQRMRKDLITLSNRFPDIVFLAFVTIEGEEIRVYEIANNQMILVDRVELESYIHEMNYGSYLVGTTVVNPKHPISI